MNTRDLALMCAQTAFASKASLDHNLGEISHPRPHPHTHTHGEGGDPPMTILWAWGGTMESLVTVAFTGTEYIANRQTYIQTFFFIYIDIFLYSIDLSIQTIILIYLHLFNRSLFALYQRLFIICCFYYFK